GIGPARPLTRLLGAGLVLDQGLLGGVDPVREVLRLPAGHLARFGRRPLRGHKARSCWRSWITSASPDGCARSVSVSAACGVCASGSALGVAWWASAMR